MKALTWRYPEWWSIALSAAAWAGLVARAVGEPTGHHAQAWAELTRTWLPWAELAGTWLLMVVAMMVPLQRFSLRLVASRSLWGRRDRAMGAFLLGYLGPWVAVGVCVAALEAMVSFPTWLGVPGFAIAAAWQLTPLKATALRACHRSRPIAPRGWRADLDCVRFGWLTGKNCLVSCWALMLACVLAGHGLVAILCVTLIAVAERYGAKPRQKAPFSPLLSLACVYGILGLSALPPG